MEQPLSSDNEMSKVNAEIRRVLDDCKKLANTHKTTQKDLESAKKQIKRLEEKLERKRKERKAKDEEITKFQDENRRLHGKQKSLEQTNMTNDERKDNIESKLEELLKRSEENRLHTAALMEQMKLTETALHSKAKKSDKRSRRKFSSSRVEPLDSESDQ